MVKKLLEKGSVRNEEYTFRMKSGELRTWLFSAEVANINNEPCILSVTTDITERKKAEEKLRQIDQMKSEFLSNVSHELRTPLATIKGYATLILDYYAKLDAEETRDYLKSIDLSTDRLTKLVDNLLDTSRMESGLLKLEKTTTNIVQLIKSVVAEASIRAEPYHFAVKAAGRVITADIDARRIRQVLDNLIDNAIKYSPPGTEIQVSAVKSGNELLVSVTDQGPGIPAGELKNIFERMYRIERRLYSGLDGIGLGLYLCQRLVEAHHGRIWAENRPGRGSIFRFILPVTGVKKRSSRDTGKPAGPIDRKARRPYVH
jgi:signal transduction histidine kinase